MKTKVCACGRRFKLHSYNTPIQNEKCFTCLFLFKSAYIALEIMPEKDILELDWDNKTVPMILEMSRNYYRVQR